MSDFVAIGRYSNWCEWDTYGPPKEEKTKEGPYRVTNLVKDGDYIQVEYPNGIRNITTVKVDDSSYETSDMGHPFTVLCKKSYIDNYINGVKVKIPLYKSGIKVKKVKNND